MGKLSPSKARFLCQSREFATAACWRAPSTPAARPTSSSCFSSGRLMTVSFLGSGTCGSRPVLALGPCLSAGPEKLRPRAGVFLSVHRMLKLQVPLSNSGCKDNRAGCPGAGILDAGSQEDLGLGPGAEVRWRGRAD